MCYLRLRYRNGPMSARTRQDLLSSPNQAIYREYPKLWAKEYKAPGPPKAVGHDPIQQS